MPTYHFHSADSGRVLDRDGIELEDDEQAWASAVRFAGESLRDHPELLPRAGHWRVEVTDGHGHLLFTVITMSIDAPAAFTMRSP